jgi:hypothetical protein
MAFVALTPRERDHKRFRDRLTSQLAADALTRIEAAPIWRPTQGNIYFLLSEVGPIKIGFAVDVSKRVKALQNMNPGKLTVAAVVAGPISLETAYHRQFDAHRLHGEWFARHPDILAEIDRLIQLRPALRQTGRGADHMTMEASHG